MRESFGKTTTGQEVGIYTLRNGGGVEARVTNFGATLVTLKVPDRNGASADIVLGYDDLQSYEAGRAFFGATVGRYANRIAKGEFSLCGKAYQLPVNSGVNSLHGGVQGFNKHMWAAKEVSTGDGDTLELTYLSKDAEEGYPGNLAVTVRYTMLAKENALRIDYQAKTDADTIVNLTNHSYFNLAGEGNGDILKHVVTLHADAFTPADAAQIPTGEIRPVQGTPLDFRKAAVVGARIDAKDEQLEMAGGYDHNWVLKAAMDEKEVLAAEVYDPQSGRVMQVRTTQVGVQFYSGNNISKHGPVKGKGGKMYDRRMALCFETQHFPDSPNHANFPTTVLRAGETFRTSTTFAFTTR
jgi:aldose 1-epimerase